MGKKINIYKINNILKDVYKNINNKLKIYLM